MACGDFLSGALRSGNQLLLRSPKCNVPLNFVLHFRDIIPQMLH